MTGADQLNDEVNPLGEDSGDFLQDGDIAQVVEEGEEPFDEQNEMDMDEMEDAEEEDATQGQTDFVDDSIQGFFDHREPVYAVAIHPTNPLIAMSGGGDDKSYLWRLDTGEKLFELAAHGDSVIDVKFCNDGTFCASGGMDGAVNVSKVETGELVLKLEGPTEVTWIDWHPNGPVLLAGGEDGSVWMWQVPSGNCMQVFTGHVDSVTSGQFTPDGKNIVTASADGSLIVWDPKTGASLHRLTAEDGRFHQTAITSLAVSPDSTIGLTGANDGTVRVTHLKTGKIVGSIDLHTESVETCVFSKTAPYFATASVDGKIAILDRNSYQQRHVLSHEDAVTRLKFHPSQPWLISTSMDRKISVWDARNGQLIQTLQGHMDPILDVDISFDGQIILTGSDDGTALVFATQSTTSQ